MKINVKFVKSEHYPVSWVSGRNSHGLRFVFSKDWNNE